MEKKTRPDPLPLTMTGDLSVEKKKAVKVVPLPEVGTDFLIGNTPFTVIYVNEGQGRFSAKPKIIE